MKAKAYVGQLMGIAQQMAFSSFGLSVRLATRCVVVCSAAAALHACQVGDRKLSFREEILLASGKVILAERVVRAKPFGEVGGPGGWRPTYMSFEILNGYIQSKPPKWESQAGLLPILFDKDPENHEWVLLATLFSCEAWYSLGKPSLPYAEFRVRNGRWQRVDFLPQWVGRDANVFTGINSEGETEFLTISEKKMRDSDPKILREYIKIIDS